jgi:hypothetical protein
VVRRVCIENFQTREKTSSFKRKRDAIVFSSSSLGKFSLPDFFVESLLAFAY